MVGRCENPNRKDYRYYGGKGIKVCENWKTYINFSKWAHQSGYADNLTIDRMDANGDYEPNNCRWVDWFAQMNNTTRNHFITANGETHTIAEWSRITGIGLSTIFYRIKAGWNPEDIVNTKKHMRINGSITA